MTPLFWRSGLLLGGFLALTLATILLTLTPIQAPQTSFSHSDKIAHVLLFGAWTFSLGLVVLSRAVDEHKQTLLNPEPAQESFWRNFLQVTHLFPMRIIFLIGAWFGLLIEILQAMLPIGRMGDLADAGADALGAFGAALLLKLIFYRSRRDLE